MKKNFKILLCAALLFAVRHQAQAKTVPTSTAQKFCFIENKGQVKDQDNNTRRDIQFALGAPGMSVFIGNGQMHYQFSHIANDATPVVKLASRFADVETATVNTYRMDVTLVGANRHAEVIAEEAQSYYENYYLAGCPANGLQAHAFGKLTYKNVYKGIDWVVRIKGNKLEHEFIVGPGGNAADIKLKYDGQTSLKINEDGSITATTPMGTITEHAPVCFRAGGNIVPSSFRLHGNILSYETNGYYHALVVDPILDWGTYYGPDTSTSPFYALACDATAHVYGAGFTYAASQIATSGTYQGTFGGDQDAYLVKFDSSGNRLWATYYGGIGTDIGYAVAVDSIGNVYLGGTTSSTTGISTPGSQQPTYGGGTRDCFLARFTADGARLWGTYMGGSGDNIPGSIATDAHWHVYLSGVTTDGTNTATPGSYQPTHSGGYDDFLVQYDSSGIRQWGTYYGGPGDEFSGVVCTDGNYAYLSGWTSSATGIATALSHQTTLAGGSDAFLAKFNVTGSRLWGTYFGGPAAETTGGATCDGNGNIYLLGNTQSDAGISTPGSFQPARGGLYDAFLAKFDPELGVLDWATYYGGPQAEDVTYSRITTDDSLNVYITGYTGSITGIASAGAWQDTFGGGDQDGFLAKYNAAGIQYWSTYFGGDGTDEARACSFDGKGVYVAGYTTSTNNIATPSGLQPTGGGGMYYYQGFLARFSDFVSGLPGPIGGGTHICIGSPTTMNDVVPGGTWASSDVMVATIGSSSGVVTGLSAGTTVFTYSISTGFVTTVVSVNPAPTAILGLTTYCIGLGTVLTDATSDGVWTSSDPAVATAGYTTGLVTGISLGTANITYTDSITTCSTSTVFTVINCISAVPSVSVNQSVEIFPSPATDALTIKMDKGVFASFMITSETGQVMQQQQITGTLVNVDVKTWPPGIYNITFTGSDGTITRKFLKE